MSQRPGTPFDNPMGSMMDMIHGNPTTPIVKGRGPRDTMADAAAQGKAIGKGVRMAGEALRTAFGGGAITGESADRRMPTEQMVIGNPMDSPMAADQVKMPQDLQAGYLNLARFGSPLPIHGLGTPGRTSLAQSIQDQNFAAYHQSILGARNPVGMMKVPFGMGGMK
jgi:hypothetical protein